MTDSIREHFLGDRDLFALRYESGLIFMEIDEYEEVVYEEFGELEDIESGTSLDGGYTRLSDSAGDDIFYVPSSGNSNTVIHAGIGIAPSQLEMFVGYPEGSRSNKQLPNLDTQPTPGANFGMVKASDSPYSHPSTFSELMVPPDQRVEFNFYNDGDDSHEPLLNIYVRKYKVNVLDPAQNINTDAVRRIVKPGSPAPIRTVGNYEQKAEYNMADKWGVTPVDRSDAISAMRGGGR